MELKILLKSWSTNQSIFLVGKKSVQLPIEYKTKIRYIISVQGNPCIPQRLTTWASFQLKSEKKNLLTTVERQLSN